MSYTNHTKLVMESIRDLIGAEFDHINVVLLPEFSPTEFKHGEYIRYNLLGDETIGYNSNGQTVQYNIELVHYFDKKRWKNATEFETIIADRRDRMWQLLHTRNTYINSTPVYVWHNLYTGNTNIGNLDLEGYEYISFIDYTIQITRFNQST